MVFKFKCNLCKKNKQTNYNKKDYPKDNDGKVICFDCYRRIEKARRVNDTN